MGDLGRRKVGVLVDCDTDVDGRFADSACWWHGSIEAREAAREAVSTEESGRAGRLGESCSDMISATT